MSDVKPEATHHGVADAPAPRRGFFGRVGAHYKRWWWVHLILLIIVVLVVTLPVVYVGYPHIAQSDVNDSSLNVTSLVFSDPTPNSVHANQTQVLSNKATYHPTIYSFNATLGLAGMAVPVSYAIVPQIAANDGEVINVDTTLQLNDLDAVTTFTKTVLTSETFNLNFYGRPQLQEGSLPKTTVTFNKTVNMKGLDGLQGFALSDIKISLVAAADGTNMNGTVNIPNPSAVSVAMGNVTLNVFVNGTNIGVSYLNDLNLVPGSNTYPIRSYINQTLVLGLVAKTGPYPSGVIPLDIIGNSSVYDGQEIPYYSQALQSSPLHTNMNITQVLINSGLGELAGAL